MRKDDELLFVEESSGAGTDREQPWKIIIADDEDEVHTVTRMVLEGFWFEDRRLDVMGAYSGEEAKALLHRHPDTALLLLDVVMEEDITGLEVVKYIRDELKNRFVRIILRTGQPGQAPERQVTTEYDINDYKEKTELTAQKLFTTVVASLRAYRDLRTIETNRKGLEQIVASSARLFELRSLKQFVESALTALSALLALSGNKVQGDVSSFAVKKIGTDYALLCGNGTFSQNSKRPVQELFPQDILTLLQKVSEDPPRIFSGHSYVGYFRAGNQAEYVLGLRSLFPFSDIEKGLIKIFSTNISIAFDNLALTEEIEETQREVIFTLGEVVETRSEDTGYHVKRVGEYCYLIARTLGMDEERAELIRLASPMHDVGKIGIPDAILHKPGKLTDEEFETIKSHTSIGYDILKGSKQEILRTAAVIALQHHERWDGYGYPLQLQGDDIDLFARIVKLADVFDALSCKRVYKEAWSLEQILETMKHDKGSHFEPVMVDLLLDNLDDFLEIRDKFRDDV